MLGATFTVNVTLLLMTLLGTTYLAFYALVGLTADPGRSR